MKRLFAALALTAAMLLAAPAASAASLELSVNGPPGSVQAGESFTVTVELNGGAEFSVAQFTLVYDRSEMECVEVTPGPLMKDMMTDENMEAANGAAVAGITATSVQSKNGGVLAVFRFTAKADLNAPGFTLADTLFGDEDNRELDISVSTGGGSGSSNTAPDAEASPSAPETSGVPETPANPQTPGIPADPSESRADPEVPASAPALVPNFSDINGHWAAENIRAAAEKGLINGYADGTFRPNQPVTRKQMTVILWRMAGKPRPAGSTPFKDLESCTEEFQNAIAWGYGAGLLNGTSADTFSPDAALTRQAAMKLLFGYAGGQAGPEALLYTTYDGTYADSAQLSAWAREPVYWGVYNGILTGNGQSLNPKGTVTRAQLAVILTRYLDRGDI